MILYTVRYGRIDGRVRWWCVHFRPLGIDIVVNTWHHYRKSDRSNRKLYTLSYPTLINRIQPYVIRKFSKKMKTCTIRNRLETCAFGSYWVQCRMSRNSAVLSNFFGGVLKNITFAYRGTYIFGPIDFGPIDFFSFYSLFLSLVAQFVFSHFDILPLSNLFDSLWLCTY